jgi:hypothetical protein
LAWEGFLSKNCKDEDKRMAFVRAYIQKNMLKTIRTLLKYAKDEPDRLTMQIARNKPNATSIKEEMEYQLFLRQVFRQISHVLKELKARAPLLPPHEQKKAQVVQAYFSPLDSESDVEKKSNLASLEFYSKEEFCNLVGVKWKTCQKWLTQFLENHIHFKKEDLSML